jgi:hypothetical protein
MIRLVNAMFGAVMPEEVQDLISLWEQVMEVPVLD